MPSRTDSFTGHPNDCPLNRGKRPSLLALLGFFLLRRLQLGGFLCQQLNSRTCVSEMCRSQERFKGSVNFCALIGRHFFGFVRELDIHSRLGFADDLGQVGGNCFYRCTHVEVARAFARRGTRKGCGHFHGAAAGRYRPAPRPSLLPTSSSPCVSEETLGCICHERCRASRYPGFSFRLLV